MTNKAEKVHYRACHLCEATCGLEIRYIQNRIIKITGDKEDPLSRGHFCPKALTLKDIQDDPDRLRQPMQRKGTEWQPISWDEAFDLTVDRIADIRARFGNNAIGIYLGNPNVHNYGMMTHGGHFFGLLRTRNRYSATSVDQLPHQLIGYWMFGHQMLIPVPDIDRTNYFLMLGANPAASNGSMWTVPDVKKRIKSLQDRGGKMVVIDPRLTETAKLADEHLFIRPGTDAALLLGILSTLVREGMVHFKHLEPYIEGFEKVVNRIKQFSPEKAAQCTGVEAETIKRLARELAQAERAICYGRLGVSVQAFGTTCQWLIQLINIVTGNLDLPGGVLFTKPAVDDIGSSKPKAGHYGAWHSRIGNLPEFAGELPVVNLANEILTEGEGQIKVLFTGAANPVLTTPNGPHLEKALSNLDFMVSLDPYINETTRFADIILPPTSALEHDHYDIVFNTFSVRNTAMYHQALFPKPEGAYHDWEIYTELGKRFAAKLKIDHRPDLSPEQMIDFALQTGPYSAQAGHAAELSMAKLKKNVRRLDLGPLEPSIPDRLLTQNKRINCAPPELLADLDRVEADLINKKATDDLLLIGRRHLFCANSWLHNFHRLVKGKNRCLLFMHPEDMDARNILDGQQVTVSSDVGEVTVAVQGTDQVMRGVVSLPHGWGHKREGTQLHIAREHPGVSLNDLVDEKKFDPICGNAVLNGVPVSVTRAEQGY